MKKNHQKTKNIIVVKMIILAGDSVQCLYLKYVNLQNQTLGYF